MWVNESARGYWKLQYALALLAAVALPMLFGGCVERKFTIRSEPPGAELLLDGEPKGKTPHTVEFMHYGTHEVVLSLKEYHRLRTYAEVKPPWYEWFLLDFFVETLWPFTVVDHQQFTFQMKRLGQVSEEELQQRVEKLRQRAETHGEPE